MRTPNSFHIMVTDTNHYVRDLLIRELAQEGYPVISIKAADDVRQFINSQAPLDLIILDPDLFYPYNHSFVTEILEDRGFSIHVIIHAFKDTLRYLKGGPQVYLVEKNAQSTRSLKDTIHRCLLSCG